MIIFVGAMLLVVPIYFIGIILWGLVKFLIAKLTGHHFPQKRRPSETDVQAMTKTYLEQIKAAFPEVKVHKKEQEEGHITYTFTGNGPNSLKVELELAFDILYLQIEQTDCGYWHTDEHENLDSYVEVAIAALKGDWQKRRGLLGREICFRQPNGKWFCTATDSPTSFSQIHERRWI